jgi:serine/threonine protein phosphatase PrpC
MRGKMDSFGLTDVGRTREVNEDQFLIADLSKSMLVHQTSLSHDDHTRLYGGSQGKLLLVADGLGGHSGGKQASALAVQGLAHYVLNVMPWFFGLSAERESDLLDELRAGLGESQRRVEFAAESKPERRGMGSTLTMAYVLWPRLYVVHAGDSRCYLLRDNRLEQVTTDHTLAQQLVERGALKPEQAEGSRWSHVLYNCIGGGSHDLNPDVYKATLQIGDTLLLCTDGLCKPVEDDRIRDVLKESATAEHACRKLVDLANDQGGPDNVTVVVSHFRDADHAKLAAREEAKAAAPVRRNGAGAPVAEAVSA